MKFTFKTEHPTGKWRSFENPIYYIKLNGKEVGRIDAEKPHFIRFAVEKDDINEDGNPNCSWKWIKLTREFDSIEEAKKVLQEACDRIVKKYNLHFFE